MEVKHRTLCIVVCAVVAVFTGVLNVPQVMAQDQEGDVAKDKATHIEVEPLPVSFTAIKSLRLRADGMLLVADAGEEVIKVIAPDGRLVEELKPGFKPEILAFGPDGALYCAGDGVVALLDDEGKVVKKAKLPEGVETSFPEQRGGFHPSSFAGLAVSDDAIFTTYGSGWSTKAQAKLVRFDIDFENPTVLAEGLRGCCQHCDIIFRDGILLLAENAAFRVVHFDRDGTRLLKWGAKSRDDISLFGSCCNPMNLTFGVDGTLYTAESGVGRVKRYSVDGKFLGLVGYIDTQRYNRGSMMASACSYVPLAVTSDGNRIYVTDVKDNIVRILQRKN